MHASFLGLAAALAAQTAPQAQAPATASPTLTLERVFASPSLSGVVPRLPKLSPDGKLVTLLRNRADDRERYDLWAIDPATGAARMLVDSTKLGSGAALTEEERMQRERARIGDLKGIVAYDWAPDGKSLIVPLDGDVYLATVDGNVRRLTSTKQPELDATASETGRYVSFVRDKAVHVLDLTTGTDKQVTPAGSDTLGWGLAEFIAGEELQRFRGHWWAPGDRRIAIARVDESPVELTTRTAIGAEKTTTVQQRYPRAGTANAIVDLYLVDPDGSEMVKADLGTNPDVYLARVDWLPDGSALIVQRESRDQKRLDYLKVDARTGASTLLFADTSDTWINLSDDLKPLKSGGFLFSSEKSGFRHLYRWNNGKTEQLTRDNWVLDGVTGVDEQAHRVYFTANRERSYEKQLYALDYTRRGSQPLQLTATGTNNAVKMDKTGRLALITASAPGQPSQTWLADGSGKRLAWIEQNQVTGNHPYAPYIAADARPEFGRLPAADGTTMLDYRILRPTLAAGQKAPVFFRVYGGPQAQDVQQGWVSPLDQWLVRQGFVVFAVGNRGQEGRGTAFQKPGYHKLGTVDVADQLAGLAWLKRQPGVDPAKVVVHGWSYGGYMTLKLLEAAPHAFAAGIAGAPVTRWDLYDTHYSEHYMGDPKVERAAYDQADALHDATRIADPLLLVHGLSDDNVLFANSTAFMAKMQEAKVPFEMAVYPGKTHSFAGPNIQVDLWQRMMDFLARRAIIAPRKPGQ